MPQVTAFDNATRNRVTPLIQLVGGNLFSVNFYDSAGSLVDTQFTFVVIGTPPAAAAAEGPRAAPTPRVLTTP
jgi:hypothetical protein